QGMGDLPTDGIELFDYLTISLEEVAAMDADHVIVWQFAADTVGVDQLAGTTEHLHVIPTGTSGDDQLRLLGDAFDRTERAEELITRLDEAVAAANDVVPDDCATSVAAIYAGPSVAAFVEPVWDVPRTVDALGCELVPGPGSMEPDGNGRVYLSMEQLGVLDGPQLVLMQTDTVPGEPDAVSEIEDGPLWAALPAVIDDRVAVIDRLGYAGILGEIRLVEDLADTLGA
ncbi:MAG: ABC transporter substrate-binding protein, partial [Desertimonas sp.]